jgi:hypothetical protein
MTSLTKATILAERLARQRFTDPVESHEEYLDLVRRLQPITPIANTRPGDPPKLVHRCTFDDGQVADRLRARQQLVKGRFAGGTVGYVLTEDFELYANAFCRPMDKISKIQATVLEVVERLGPITAKQIKEETGFLSKEIGPALQRLQQAFLVFEEQVDEDWERPWYPLRQVFPDVKVSPERWEGAASEIVRRFLEVMVFATAEQVRDWSQFPRKGVESLLAGMAQKGTIEAVTIEGLGEGWMIKGERLAFSSTPPETVFMLHKADFLVRAHLSELKERHKDMEVLEYLLIDGEFQGAVLGHWGFNPYDVEDIVVALSKSEQHRRRESIIMEVRRVYAPPTHDIVRYGGELI